jgi:hypothetical protein
MSRAFGAPISGHQVARCCWVLSKRIHVGFHFPTRVLKPRNPIGALRPSVRIDVTYRGVR